MANAIEAIERNLTTAIDTVFAVDSKTALFMNGQKYINPDFKEAGYVKVMSMLMDGLSDYYKVNGGNTGDDYAHYNNGSADGYKKGNVTSTWEIFQLSYDRGKQFQVDATDNADTDGLVLGNLLAEFLRTKVVPEADAVRFSKIAAKASSTLGNLVTETISANAILSDFNTGFQWLTEHEVPAENQAIFVSPATMTLINNTDELSKMLMVTDAKIGEIDVKITKYNGRPIIEVPPSRFFTDVVCGANGYYPGDDSKLINYMICDVKAVVPVVKVEKSKIWTPDQVQDFDGYKVNVRILHDLIIPKNKICGCYVSVSSTAATTKTSKLDVAISASGTSYVVDEYYTTPAGLNGTLVHSASAFTLGATVTIDDSTIEAITAGTAYTALATTEYYALVDANNVVLAVSSAIDLSSL